MELKRFKRIDNLVGAVIFLIAACTYLLTIEPTTSFWDCGEFIASSYKLEIGHAPGNPVFQIIARVATFFGNKEQAAALVNSMSAVCSALTILFLFWTITHLGRRILERKQETLSLANVLSVLGAGVVGALAYTFSDSFWFSAVEGEVYAMSSLFTAAVFWAMLKWEEEADQTHANRWIVLISYLMGLSIGVHLLNLLTIPALVFLYYYKKYPVTKKGAIYTFLISCILLVSILYGIIPWLPRIASWFDLLFVNTFGLGFNSGTATFMMLLLMTCFATIWYTFRKGKVLWNTVALCFTMIVIGYSSFAVVIIRASANTPTNEGQPDNPFSLMSYLGREQYGSQPLFYGPSYSSPVEALEKQTYYAKVDDKYQKLNDDSDLIYNSNGKTFFPRMWSGQDKNHVQFYEQYTKGKGKSVVSHSGSLRKIPYFKDNMAFFLDYQLDWMYFRYFMWNFAGRQNDIHGTNPGDPFRGNWESGIGFIDQWRLGDQSEGPAYVVKSKAKNHFYFLPLLLGLIGFFYQLGRDKRNTWVTFLLFFLTGIAIVLYLNQPPYQVRERDYAYAGSFYAFAIWIGLAVMAIDETLRQRKLNKVVCASIAGGICILVPIQMASQTWDDHDRSHRYTARDIGYNYLIGCGPNAILITIGDNDTFPLWYIQEVEGVRTDVRIVNTSLLGTDWYIDQMKYQTYESVPLPFTIPRELYIKGVNAMPSVVERANEAILLKLAMSVMASPKYKDPNTGDTFLPARKLLIPVNKENALKYGIVNQKDSAKILDVIELNIPEGQEYISKSDMMILDLLSTYQWDRPIHMTALGGGLNIGDIEKYLQFDGFGYRLVPILCNNEGMSPSQLDTDFMYEMLTKTYKLESLADPRIHIDQQHFLTFGVLMNVRGMCVNTAEALAAEGQKDKAIEILDRAQVVMPQYHFPLNLSVYDRGLNAHYIAAMVRLYVALGEKEKAVKLGDALAEESFTALKLFGQPRLYSESDFDRSVGAIYDMMTTLSPLDSTRTKQYEQRLKIWMDQAIPQR